MTDEKVKFEDSLIERKKRAEIIQNLPAQIVAVGESITQQDAKELLRTLNTVVNDNDKRCATLPMKTIGKLIGHKGYNFSRIFGEILPLYQTSLFGWSEPEIIRTGHKVHTNIKAYHNYINKFDDGYGKYYIRFTLHEENVRHGKIGRNLIHSAAISDIAVYKKDDCPYRVPVIDWGETNQPSFIDKKNNHSQRTWVMDPDEGSPSPFIDKKLQNFFDL